MAGQGTWLLEALEDGGDAAEAVVVPVSGGGLASGTVLAAEAADWGGRIIGVEPAGADDTRRSLAAGRRVRIEQPDTIADALRASTPGALTFEVMRRGLAGRRRRRGRRDHGRHAPAVRARQAGRRAGRGGRARPSARRPRRRDRAVLVILSGGNVSAPPVTEHDLRPFTPARRRTAELMVLSRATSAHAFVALEADYERVDAVRRSAGLTYLPFVVAALARAVRDFPLVNASVVADGVVVHPDVNVGVAVDLGERGLIVPVVRDAASLTVEELAAAIASAAERARARRLPPAAGCATARSPSRTSACSGPRSPCRSSTSPRSPSSPPTACGWSRRARPRDRRGPRPRDPRPVVRPPRVRRRVRRRLPARGGRRIGAWNGLRPPRTSRARAPRRPAQRTSPLRSGRLVVRVRDPEVAGPVADRRTPPSVRNVASSTAANPTMSGGPAKRVPSAARTWAADAAAVISSASGVLAVQFFHSTTAGARAATHRSARRARSASRSRA